MRNQQPAQRFRSGWHVFITLMAALVVYAPSASAQLGRIGVNPGLISFPVRGSDVAYDAGNNIYLVVGAHGTVQGLFVDTAGNPLTAPFAISGGAAFAQYPRVAYSPHASNGVGGFGAFLVTWHEGVGSNFVNTRIVAYPNRLVSPQRVIAGNPTWWESGAAIAYSTSSQFFLVTWRDSGYVIWGARVGLDGQVIGSPFTISDTSVGSRDPNVAWNPFLNEFGVVYTGFASSGATATFARVSAGGGVLRRNTFSVAPATYITDLAFNTATAHYVAVWYETATLGVELDQNGDVVARGLVSTTTGRYDALGLAYNPVSGTFLVVGQGPSYDVWAAELNGRGARTSADTSITSAGGPIGSFYPRAAANLNTREWNLSFSHNFGVLRDQVANTSSSGGGPGGTLGTVTGGTSPPPTTSGGCTTPDPFAAMGGGKCVNGGWLPPGSTSGSTSGGCTTPSPGTGWTCVNGGWKPPTTTSGGCTTPPPGTGWTCVNGGWFPPTSTTSSGGCTTPSPGTGWTCVNGGWVPPTSTSTSGGCTTPDPFTAIGGGTCVNGGWTPGGSGSTSGGCTTPSPGTGWTCVNGGWRPPTSTSTSGGCTTPDPFTAIGGGTCVNGGWTPGGSTSGGCTTPSPGTGWTCVNGGWRPPTSTSTSGGCTTPDPFTAMGGGTCVNGGWTFGSSSSCTTPDPFTAIGGGVCINGGWVPKKD